MLFTYRVEIACEGCETRYLKTLSSIDHLALPALGRNLIERAMRDSWTFDLDGQALWCPRCQIQRRSTKDIEPVTVREAKAAGKVGAR